MVSGDDDNSSFSDVDGGVTPAADIPGGGIGGEIHGDADDVDGDDGDKVAGKEGRDDEETESEED